MLRKARIDVPGALHRIIVRGIEQRWIFMDLLQNIPGVGKEGPKHYH